MVIESVEEAEHLPAFATLILRRLRCAGNRRGAEVAHRRRQTSGTAADGALLPHPSRDLRRKVKARDGVRREAAPGGQECDGSPHGIIQSNCCYSNCDPAAPSYGFLLSENRSSRAVKRITRTL